MITKQPSLTLSFLGPDGSGKSTIINAVTNAGLPFERDDYFHLKPIVKPNTSEASEIVADPHKYPPYSPLKSYLKLLFFIYQYNLGWLKHIRPLKAQSSLIIFDRYYDDLLVDNRRYRFGGSLSIARFVRKLIPRPELYFILVADPSVIYKRKQEVEFKELERQVALYKSLADGKRYFLIDVNNSVEDITAEVVRIITEKINERG